MPSSRSGVWAVVGLLASGVAGACGSSQTSAVPAGVAQAGAVATTPPTAASAGIRAPATVAGTSAPTVPPPAAGGRAMTAAAGQPAGAPVAGDLPCAVAHFLDMYCVECHGSKPRLGAPISLVSAASFQRMGMSGLPLTQVVVQRLQSTERPMPPAMLLPAAEIAPVVQWLGGGAVADASGCAVHDLSAMGAAGAPAAVGGAGMPAVGSAITGEGAGWSMFGGDLGNTRANLKETTLSVQNVAKLKELWTFRGAGVTATPAVADGVAYLPTWSGDVVALDAKTGMQRWTTKLPDLIDSSPALSATQLFVSDDQGSVHALERATGKLQWSKLVDMHAEAHLWSSPIYVPDAELVLVGVASGEEAVNGPYTFRGSVVALDAKTGTEKWKFWTTAGDSTSGPGVGVWATVAVDPVQKLAFVGTGNAYAMPAGPNVDSLLALQYETGKLAWSKQFTANDVFTVLGMVGPDFDIGASANVFNVGGMDLVGIGIKSGDYVALERATGKPVWMHHLTQGSVQGGIISSPAYADGKVFVASNTYPAPQTVTLFALDATSGNPLWMNKISNAVAYGGVIYANGIVFMGVTSGLIAAYDAASGKQLWMANAPDSIAGGPSVANGMLFVPWGYMWTLREGSAGSGGLTAYGIPQ